jgi:hypothetical protein
MTVRVVAAALNISGAIITPPPPARHHDLIHWVGRYMPSVMTVTQEEQGFLLSDGTFVSRVDAYVVAVRAADRAAW